MCPNKGALANSVYPDQTLQDAASNQDLHYLHKIQNAFENKTESKSTTLIPEIDLSQR